ncbi:alpha/beta hydrolase fold domain-containing protein [Xylophilus rhododendri]|uniref:Alpha/beta hydrolase fold domain-containing protein n=1 Tax=Xylophilus rhododendri TaxID=2697032 RepID=A0A857JAT9_9BURK|nr:alpha/beta hydrolase [Xylophilus rhododendri]QHI99845.1 alpha/beta hydrolase fold domain-containing protein [Xylophilus rhododendri]
MNPVLDFDTLDQATLDRLLDQRAWARDMDAGLARYAATSAALRGRLPHRADIAYGPDPAQRMDWFAPSSGSGRAVVVFVHGGAWRSGSKETNSFAAGTVLAAGAHFVPIEFAQCPAVSLATMAQQVREAIAHVRRCAAAYGADPQRIVLAGHSSGSHLLALALATDWQAEFGLPGGFLRAAICSSGFYEMAPVARSARNQYLGLDAAEARALSPIHQVGAIACPVFVGTGELDNPLMQAQADAFAAALDSRGLLMARETAPDLDHFEVAETYASPEGMLGRALLAALRLAEQEPA